MTSTFIVVCCHSFCVRIRVNRIEHHSNSSCNIIVRTMHFRYVFIATDFVLFSSFFLQRVTISFCTNIQRRGSRIQDNIAHETAFIWFAEGDTFWSKKRTNEDDEEVEKSKHFTHANAIAAAKKGSNKFQAATVFIVKVFRFRFNLFYCETVLSYRNHRWAFTTRERKTKSKNLTLKMENATRICRHSCSCRMWAAIVWLLRNIRAEFAGESFARPFITSMIYARSPETQLIRISVNQKAYSLTVNRIEFINSSKVDNIFILFSVVSVVFRFLFSATFAKFIQTNRDN